MSEASKGPRRLPLPLPRWTVPVVGVVVLLVAGVALVVMWRWVDSLVLADPEKKATTQLEVIKAASGIAIGGGGLFAPYLAARRQRTQELELEVRRDERRNRQVELVQRDQTQEHAESTAEVTRLHAEQVAADARHDAAERRLTELYTKAAEQFGSDNVAVQLAGSQHAQGGCAQRSSSSTRCPNGAVVSWCCPACKTSARYFALLHQRY